MKNHCFVLRLLSVACLCRAQNSFYDTTTVCSDSAVTVTALELACDTPGTFYYGSGGYRNSETCQAGDKAKMTLYFNIENEYLEDDDLAITVISSAPPGSEDAVVYLRDQLCSLSALKSVNGTSCPSMGSYEVSASFYFSTTDDNYVADDDSSQYFIPTVEVGFASSQSNGEFDLGGANTNNCAGDYEEASLVNYFRRGGSPLSSILWNFGILIGTVTILVMFGWYVLQRTSCAGRICFFEEEKTSFDTEEDKKSQLISFDIEKDKKSQLMGNTKGLID